MLKNYNLLRLEKAKGVISKQKGYWDENVKGKTTVKTDKSRSMLQHKWILRHKDPVLFHYKEARAATTAKKSRR